MRPLLVRHTRVAVAAGLCYGRTDVPLAETFAEDARAVRNGLPWTPRLVWTSPASRCRRLAEHLGAPEIRVEPRLAELDMGEWDGRPWEELSGPVHEAWKRDPWGTRPPGGENAADLLRRVGAFRAELHAARGEAVAVVTHAGVIRAWRSVAEGRPLPDLFSERIAFGSMWTAH